MKTGMTYGELHKFLDTQEKEHGMESDDLVELPNQTTSHQTMYKLIVTGLLEIGKHDTEILEALQGEHGEYDQRDIAIQELSENCKDVTVTIKAV